MEYGFDTTCCRSRGISRVARSILSSSRSRSGMRSSHHTIVIVERRRGSFSMCHMSASLSLMRCSKRTPPLMKRMLERWPVLVERCRPAWARIDPKANREVSPPGRAIFSPLPSPAYEDPLRAGCGRLRRQGQRLLVLPAALLQPGARAAGILGRPGHHAGARRRRVLRPRRRLRLGPPALALGPAASLPLRLGHPGGGRLLVPLEPAHGAVERRALRLLPRRGDAGAHLRRGERGPERLARARPDRRLRRAHVHPQPSILPRLD